MLIGRLPSTAPIRRYRSGENVGSCCCPVVGAVGLRPSIFDGSLATRAGAPGSVICGGMGAIDGPTFGMEGRGSRPLICAVANEVLPSTATTSIKTVLQAHRTNLSLAGIRVFAFRGWPWPTGRRLAGFVVCCNAALPMGQRHPLAGMNMTVGIAIAARRLGRGLDRRNLRCDFNRRAAIRYGLQVGL